MLWAVAFIHWTLMLPHGDIFAPLSRIDNLHVDFCETQLLQLGGYALGMVVLPVTLLPWRLGVQLIGIGMIAQCLTSTVKPSVVIFK